MWFSPFIFFTETLRKYPILPFLDRWCSSDYKLPSPSGIETITLPAGTVVFVSVLGIQHDPLYFPQPDMFDPDRFTEENKRSRPKYAYIPFGEGLRMCIGNITLSILNYKIVDFKDRTVKFMKLHFVRPGSSVVTKWMSQSHTFYKTETGLNVIHCNKCNSHESRLFFCNKHAYG
jgi:hypothetical protein